MSNGRYYVATHAVTAEPMTYGEYEQTYYTTESLDGRCVQYPCGWRTWLPDAVIDRAYQESPTDDEADLYIRKWAGSRGTPYVHTYGNRVVLTMQYAIVGEVGIKGIQVDDILEMCRDIIRHCDQRVPSHHNSVAIKHIRLALDALATRRHERVAAGVEGRDVWIP